MVVPRAGGTVRDLVPGYRGHIWFFAWQDDWTLVYVGQEGVWNVLNSVALDCLSRLNLVLPGRYVFGSLSLSKDGRIGAVIGQDATHPEEVCWYGCRRVPFDA